MVQLAILGNGDRAARHIAACQRVAGINLVAVTGPGAATSDVPWTTDIHDLLTRSDIEAVDIVAPPAQTAEIAVAAAKAGKQVLVEYLAGGSTGDAECVAEACRQAGVSLTQLRPERTAPLPRQYKATLEDGKLGSLRFGHSASIWSWEAADQAANRSWGSASPADDPAQFLLEYATAPIDTMNWFFAGTPIKSVFSRDCSLGENGSASRFVSIVLFFADSSQAICEVGLTDRFASETGIQRLSLTGMRGSAYFNDRHHDIVLGARGTRPLIDDPVDGTALALRAWANGGSSAAGDDLDSSAVAFAAVESLRTGQPVEVG